MDFSKSVLRAGSGLRAPPRSLNLKVQAAQRGTVQAAKDSKNNSTERVLETVEVAALAVAAGGHLLAATRSSHMAPQASTTGRKGEAPAPTAPPAFQTSNLWMTGPLLLALAARTIASRMAKKRAQATPAAQAMARLAAAETSLNAQAEAMATLSRQVDKLQIRTRLVSRDVRDQLKETQAATVAQGEAILGTTMKVQQIEDDVKTMESLVEALQGLVAKQFSLVTSVIAQQKKVGVTAGAAKKKQAAAAAAPGGKAQPTMTSTAGRNGAAASVETASNNTMKTEVQKSGEQDEWGRRVVASSNNAKAAAAVPIGGEAEGNSNDRSGGEMKLNEDGSVSFSFQ